MRWLTNFGPAALLALAGCNMVFPNADQLLCREPVLIAQEKAPQLLPVAAWQEDKKEEPVKPKTLVERLTLPKIIPGAEAPDIKLPPIGSPKKEIEAALKKYFPPLPALPALPKANPTPLSLADLQESARANSPVLRQAALDIDAARGAAIQAGLYPNPSTGYQADSIGNNKSNGAQGAFVEQTFKTAGKLRLARAAALMDVRVSEAKFRQSEAEVLAQVRNQYFAVLAARRNFEVTRALAQFTDEVYKVLVLQMQAGEVAAYEPMQVRVLALQARTQLIQAHNRYVSAWKQLAAALGTPELGLTELLGQIEQPIPRYDWEATLAYVLSQHSDILAANASLDKTALQLQLARVQPIPDIDVRGVVQYDATSDPKRTTSGVSVGFQLPIFDRNQGNILQASANHRRAQEEFGRVRANLTARLADAFERYENNRQLLEYYRKEMLPNQVQAFRAAVARHAGAGPKEGVSYNDLVTAEQTLVTLVGNYLSALRDQWTAVVDIAGLLQEPDLLPREK
jgi:cobalt-zinc-cadmium efflux system outer membrane protein